jgi:hypothetical protein
MKKIIKKSDIFLVFLSLFIIAVFGYFIFNDHEKQVQAKIYDAGPPVTGDNLSGFAWSSNIGWISFNVSDCDTDGDGTYEGASENGGAAPAECPTSGTAHDYGVNIDKTTGNLSGYAWSENVGWVSFEESGTPDNTEVTNNCDASCDPTVDCTACNNSSEIYGWAKILSMGDDGWISLRGTSPDYGISADVANSELTGWAWNGNVDDSGIGWISFNADDCDNNGATYINDNPVG